MSLQTLYLACKYGWFKVSLIGLGFTFFFGLRYRQPWADSLRGGVLRTMFCMSYVYMYCVLFVFFCLLLLGAWRCLQGPEGGALGQDTSLKWQRGRSIMADHLTWFQ